MSTFVPVSTHAVESTVIKAPIDAVWAKISALDFSWWGLVKSVEVKHGASSACIGAVLTISFNDGVTWDVQIVEMRYATDVHPHAGD